MQSHYSCIIMQNSMAVCLNLAWYLLNSIQSHVSIVFILWNETLLKLQPLHSVKHNEGGHCKIDCEKHSI